MEAINESASARHENSRSLLFAPEVWMAQGVHGVLYCVWEGVCVHTQDSWRCSRDSDCIYDHARTSIRILCSQNISRRCIKSLDCSCLRALLEWGGEIWPSFANLAWALFFHILPLSRPCSRTFSLSSPLSLVPRLSCSLSRANNPSLPFSLSSPLPLLSISLSHVFPLVRSFSFTPSLAFPLFARVAGTPGPGAYEHDPYPKMEGPAFSFPSSGRDTQSKMYIGACACLCMCVFIPSPQLTRTFHNLHYELCHCLLCAFERLFCLEIAGNSPVLEDMCVWNEISLCSSLSCFSLPHKLQHNATQCNTMRHTATYCNTPQHTATHYNTLQHPIILCTNFQCAVLSSVLSSHPLILRFLLPKGPYHTGCLYVYIYIYSHHYTRTNKHMNVYTHTHMYTYVYIYAYIYIYAHNTHTHTHTHTHTRIHTYTHIYT